MLVSPLPVFSFQRATFSARRVALGVTPACRAAARPPLKISRAGMEVMP
jgi:hypothetical protein